VRNHVLWAWSRFLGYAVICSTPKPRREPCRELLLIVSRLVVTLPGTRPQPIRVWNRRRFATRFATRSNIEHCVPAYGFGRHVFQLPSREPTKAGSSGPGCLLWHMGSYRAGAEAKETRPTRTHGIRRLPGISPVTFMTVLASSQTNRVSLMALGIGVASENSLV